MSTIITALLILICTVGIPLIFISIAKKKNKKQKEIYLKLFSQEGTRQGLSFSSQELFKNKIIGLDGIKKVLFVFDFENAGNNLRIALEEVKSCNVEKKYDSINVGTDKKAKMEAQLRSIDLKFAFINNVEPVSISFFDCSVSSIYEMAELEAKARTWEAALSKLIFKQLKASA